MPPQRELKRSRLNDAIQFYRDHSNTYTIAWVAVKYNVIERTLRRHLSKHTALPTSITTQGGHNRLLTPKQDAAIVRFIHD